jgi:Tfp pilus assembly protein PilE
MIKQPRKQQGFTLVEVLVVTPIMALTIAILASLLVTLYTDLAAKSGRMQLDTSAQSALFTMRDDMFYSLRFAGKQQPDIPSPNSEPPSGSQWNAIGHNALIVYEAAYTANRQNSGRHIIYKKDAPFTCTNGEVNQNQISTNTIIYYFDAGNQKVYRRVLIPDQALNCAATYRKKTCRVQAPGCAADTVIATDVDQFNITYYDSGGNVISAASLQAAPEKFIQVQRADVKIVLKKYINGEPAVSSARISIKAVE